MNSWALNGISAPRTDDVLFARNTYNVSEETRVIQSVSKDIERINRETDYIKKHGEAPPSLGINFSKNLDVI